MRPNRSIQMTSIPARKRCASILPNLLFLFAFLLLAPTAGHAANVCDSFYSSNFQLALGQLNPAMAALAKPAKGVAVHEPNFHTCLVRATSHATEPPNTFARNDYSRRQAFNANNSYFIVYSNGTWHLYDANSLAHVRVLTTMGGDAEPQWHPTDPNILYYLPTNGGTKLLKVDVRNNTASTAVDFVGRLPSWGANADHIWTRSEGSPSADGRYWGFLVYTANWDMLGYIVWDLQQNQLAGSRASTAPQDNASMSASGRWFINSGEGDGTWAWSRDFTTKKKLDNSYGVHSDLALSPSGQDYYISVDYESSGGDVYFTNLDTCPSVPASATSAPVCPRTVLFSMYPTGGWATMHFSGKAFSKPGWVLISTYDSETNGSGLPWFTNKVMAVELKASPRIYVLAYTRRVRVTSGDTDGAGNYWAEPHASVNRNFTRILFNTNWSNSVGPDIDAYMIQLPTWVLGGTPATGPSTGGNLPAVPVGGSNATAPVSSATSATPSSTSSAPAVTSTDAGTYSIGCPACNRLAQARSVMAAMVGYLWDRARPGLLSTLRALDFSRDEPARRTVSAARTVPALIATAAAAETESATAPAVEPQAEQAETAPESKTTAAVATVASGACRTERGVDRIERDSRETSAAYGSCQAR
jgi:hypothetical protein